MTATRQKELDSKRKALLDLMLQKAGVTKKDIHDVAERRWVNANLDLLSSADKKQFADVLSL